MIDHGFGVELDRLSEADLLKLIGWRNDYRVWKWCRQNDLIHWDQHYDWFKRIQRDPKISMFGVWSNNRIVGVCGLTDIDRINQRAEFSLYIEPEMQGQGFGQSALQTLLKHAFYSQNLNVVWGETVGDNPAQRIFEKCGMIKEGTRREFYFREGRFQDSHLYSITATDFWGKYE